LATSPRAQSLVGHGCDIDAIDAVKHSARTALRMALEEDRGDIVEYLLRKGVRSAILLMPSA